MENTWPSKGPCVKLVLCRRGGKCKLFVDKRERKKREEEKKGRKGRRKEGKEEVVYTPTR